MDEIKLLFLQKPLHDYVAFFENLSVRSLAMYETLAQPGVIYTDALGRLVGAQAVQEYWRCALEQFPAMKIRCTDRGWSEQDSTIYISWTADLAPDLRLDGIGLITFGPDGLVQMHSDHWDIWPCMKDSGGLQGYFARKQRVQLLKRLQRARS